MRQQKEVRIRDGRTRGRLLIINLRGFGRADPLYAALAALGWQTTVLDLPVPATLHWYARARSFRPTLTSWRLRYDQMANRLGHTALAFKYNSRRCAGMIRKAGVQYDLILQGGGMFAPAWPLPPGPYALICDCTTKLSESHAEYGPDFASSASAQRWYDLERKLYQQARGIFSTSEYVTRSFIRDFGVKPERVLTIGEGCNLESSNGLQRAYDGRTILYVGYEFHRKGGEVLLEAFERVAAAIPDAQLLLAGPPRIGRPLPPGVRLLGRVSPEQVSELYSRASLFVMPSLFEPFGQVFLEAMEHRLPCIGTDRCAMPEIILDGETGLIAPAGDVTALAEAMLRLLRSPDTMRRMGERGRERVRQFFTWRAVAQKMDERLIEILSASAVTPERAPSWSRAS